jgi:hypothetical protein
MRGGKALALYARVTEAQAPLAIVLPASSDSMLQVHMGGRCVVWICMLGEGEYGGGRAACQHTATQ